MKGGEKRERERKRGREGNRRRKGVLGERKRGGEIRLTGEQGKQCGEGISTSL